LICDLTGCRGLGKAGAGKKIRKADRPNNQKSLSNEVGFCSKEKIIMIVQWSASLT
jgi:hypothetical protein